MIQCNLVDIFAILKSTVFVMFCDTIKETTIILILIFYVDLHVYDVIIKYLHRNK